MTVNLYANNGELLRAAYTAMDQTYGAVKTGDDLKPIDNAALGTSKTPRDQPFQTPPGYKVAAVIDDPAGFGGKFVVYKNDAANIMLVNAMGTNGWGDTNGWYTNVTSYGIDQWRRGDIRTQVFQAMATAGIDSGTQIVFNGDSKGGMLAQIMAYDFVKERNLGTDSIFNASNLASLLSVANNQLAVVTHSSAGIEDYLKRQASEVFDPTWSAFRGIAADSTAFRDAATRMVEPVSMIGGDTLNGFGLIRYFESASVLVPANPLEIYQWMHRLTRSAWAYLRSTNSPDNPNNANPGIAPWAPRETFDVSELAMIGALCAGGQPGMSDLEARARIGASLTCGLAFAPQAAAISLWKDSLTTEAAIGGAVGAMPPVQALFAGLAVGFLTAANVTRTVNENLPGIQESIRDIALAIGDSSQAISDFGTNLFGSTRLALDLDQERSR